MGETTGISWSEKTWNPWHGCIKIDPLCKFCYMYREKRKYGQDPMNVVRSKTTFYDPLKWKDPALVFTCSWSDFFIEQADEWRDDAWSVIKRTPHLTYQVLTKRTERVADHLPADWGDGYPNVWLGFSAGTQESFDRRWKEIRRVPNALLWCSAEPLLESLDVVAALEPTGFQCADPDCVHRHRSFLSEAEQAEYELTEDRVNTKGDTEQGDPICLDCGEVGTWTGYDKGIEWLITGGESGNADEAVRPSHPDWFRKLRDDCVAANVPFHFKQWGEWIDNYNVNSDWWNNGGFEKVKDSTNVGNLTMHRVGKKVAGRLLDGREWNEFPRTN